MFGGGGGANTSLCPPHINSVYVCECERDCVCGEGGGEGSAQIETPHISQVHVDGLHTELEQSRQSQQQLKAHYVKRIEELHTQTEAYRYPTCTLHVCT